MLHEIALEALRYFDRTALEGLQMHSRHLRDLVNRHARTLPLRPIHGVTISNDGEVSVRLLKEGRDGIRVGSPDEQSLEALFYRVNNAFIHTLMFFIHHQHLPLIYRLHDNSSNLQCRIGALSVIDCEVEAIDYALFDFLGVHLMPLSLEIMVRSPEFLEDYAMLFARSALRNSVANLVYSVCNNTPVPDCIIPELFGGNIKTCEVTAGLDPRSWILIFIQMFESVERGTDILQSVSLLHEYVSKASPLRHTFDLGRARRSDAPVPHVAWIKQRFQQDQRFFGASFSESNVADLFVFENAKSSKKLEVYAWTIEQGTDVFRTMLS